MIGSKTLLLVLRTLLQILVTLLFAWQHSKTLQLHPFAYSIQVLSWKFSAMDDQLPLLIC
jgi:hypothetical protein